MRMHEYVVFHVEPWFTSFDFRTLNRSLFIYGTGAYLMTSRSPSLPLSFIHSQTTNALTTAQHKHFDHKTNSTSTMAQPNQLKLKRKRTDEPLEFLVLQGVKQDATDKHYIRKRVKGDSSQEREIKKPTPRLPNATSQQQRARREFQLQLNKRKRSAGHEDIATFVERKKTKQQTSEIIEEATPQEEAQPTTPFKRPGKGSTIKKSTPTRINVESEADRKQIEALAAYMHEAALDEIKNHASPKPVATPKLSGARSREIHRQRAATNGSMRSRSDMELDDEDGYVYDTYVLAPSTDIGAVQVDELGQLDNVGYLVITDDDRSLWETYLEEEAASDQDWNSDEDDENAENYYAADYPDEEMGSDDDLFWDVIDSEEQHRPAGDEEYDEYTGRAVEEEDVFRSGTVPRRFQRYLEEDGNDSD